MARVSACRNRSHIETLRNYIDWTPFFCTRSWPGSTRAFWKMKWWA
ncbi:hypothetical protein ACLK1T_10210 [Escherichia coli]